MNRTSRSLLAALTLTVFAAGAQAAELSVPEELKNTPKEKIFQFKPDAGKPNHSVADEDAEGKTARKIVYPATQKINSKQIAVQYFMPPEANKWGKGAPIQTAGFTPGKYRWVKWGSNKVFPDTIIVLNGNWGGPLDIRNAGKAVREHGKKHTLFLRLKIDGPAFFASSQARENSVFIDRILFVEE